MTTYRSLLFVPGARPDRFEKAASAGADAIIIDLEDAVLPADKAKARADTLGWLAEQGTGTRAGLRINSLRTADGCADIAALAHSAAKPAFVMVPKAETAADVEIAYEALGEAVMIAVIESPRGLANVRKIARHAKGGLLFGGADFSASLGADLADWDAMLHARSAISSAAAEAGISAYDVPFLDVKDAEGLAATTSKAKALGFSGRSCIHPAQIEHVNAVFTPTQEEIADARGIIAALENAQGGAALYNGKLVDRPIILAAERTLAKAGHKEL